MEYIFSISRGTTNYYGTVGVIDGKTLKLTSFQEENVPPPMAQFEMEVSSNIIDVAFNRDGTKISVLDHQSISIFATDQKDGDADTLHTSPKLKSTVDFRDSDCHTFQQIAFAGNDELYVLQRDFKDTDQPNRTSSNSIHHFAYNPANPAFVYHNEEKCTTISPVSMLLESNGQHLPTFFQTGKGSINAIRDENGIEQALPSFPDFLPWTEIIKHGEDLIAFGLSRNGHLYADNRLLVKNCTSFLTTPDHMIFTTTTHLLKFVHITNVPSKSPPSYIRISQANKFRS